MSNESLVDLATHHRLAITGPSVLLPSRDAVSEPDPAARGFVPGLRGSVDGFEAEPAQAPGGDLYLAVEKRQSVEVARGSGIATKARSDLLMHEIFSGEGQNEGEPGKGEVAEFGCAGVARVVAGTMCTHRSRVTWRCQPSQRRTSY